MRGATGTDAGGGSPARPPATTGAAAGSGGDGSGDGTPRGKVGAAIGEPRIHHAVTDSTNERARELAADGAAHGTLVTADEQTAGRGRQGRGWIAARGEALLMSVVVREPEPRRTLLPLIAALAVCDTVEEVAGDGRAEIKWPNDVWVDRRKVSGILVEARPADGWAVVGIGLNTGVGEFPDDLRETATTLHLPSPEAALAPLLAALDRWLAADRADILAAWRIRDALLDQPVRWQDGEGTARGIDDSGALLVDTPSGRRVTLDAGEIHLQR
jgi:BirA family biotin operon repressor/biotin-[acetyl-CoA-carboxylase] ligase